MLFAWLRILQFVLITGAISSEYQAKSFEDLPSLLGTDFEELVGKEDTFVMFYAQW